MKTKLAILSFVLILGMSLNAQLSTENMALTEESKMLLSMPLIADDEDAIKKTIIAETDHYFERDIIGWKACFVDSGKTTLIQKYNNGELQSVIGLDEMAARANKAIKENPDMDFKTKDRLQWNININGNVAWVSFKHKSIINGTEHTSEEIRVMVKEDNTWKIALISSIY